jgi:ABC-type oligopeptide transport system substrate-binding subunit
MSQNAFSAIAFVAALTFLAMALAACASTEQHVSAPAAVYKGNGVAEFHAADIGGDALRGELPSEN